MGLIIALIIVAVWIGVLIFVLAVCKASGHADAAEERNLAEARNVPSHSPAPHLDATGLDQGNSIDPAELEREAERLRIELPDRPRLRLTRLVGTRRQRS
jgi:hypothetical protein